MIPDRTKTWSRVVEDGHLFDSISLLRVSQDLIEKVNQDYEARYGTILFLILLRDFEEVEFQI